MKSAILIQFFVALDGIQALDSCNSILRNKLLPLLLLLLLMMMMMMMMMIVTPRR